jgi:pimeloyl-ACP methyl ester carboxylesterase
VVLCVAGLAGCAWIDATQRAKGYRPSPGTLADWTPITAQDEPLWLELPAAPTGAAPQRLRALWIPAADPAAPSVLYLHGTFRNVFQNRPKIAAIHAAGFSVLAVDYRGWGESSTLLPSEQTILEDGEVAWAELARRARQPDSRVIFGHSMGSGVAVELALRHRSPASYGALVLESGITSGPDVVRDYGAFGAVLAPLVTQQFASIEKIGRIDAPKWFLSGSADKTVPPQQTRALYAAAREPKFIEIFEGGSHSGLHKEFEQRYRAVWQEVAAGLAGTGPAVAPQSPAKAVATAGPASAARP